MVNHVEMGRVQDVIRDGAAGDLPDNSVECRDDRVWGRSDHVHEWSTETQGLGWEEISGSRHIYEDIIGSRTRVLTAAVCGDPCIKR